MADQGPDSQINQVPANADHQAPGNENNNGNDGGTTSNDGGTNKDDHNHTNGEGLANLDNEKP